MAHIRVIPPDEAEGDLKAQYDAAVERAGRIFHIVGIQSVNPAALAACIGLYRALMFGESPLSRADREMLATVTSAANGCVY